LKLFTLPYSGVSPEFAGPPRVLGPRAAVLGRATIGAGASFATAAVVRADGHFVRIGNDFHLGEHATVHIAHDLYPTIIGNRVTVGTNGIVHACTLGSDIVVGANAVILDGSEIEDGVIFEPGSVVFPRSKVAGGHLYAGSPAKPLRPLRPGEIGERATAIRSAKATAAPQGAEFRNSISGLDESVFIARTAAVRGRITAAANSSVWFGCELDADDGKIVIGLNANIQDNSVIRCRPRQKLEIGADTTIGHNVRLADCRIGERSLIGMGSVVAPGTVIEDDVFLAAGAETIEGQVLESGWLWGKRPAQRMAPLDSAKREVIATTIAHYCGYAQRFRQAQAEAQAVPLA
jgi:carbonic anhydrase/acetyltransferase-like protein (isoleucine patch superfamily)